MRNLSFDRLQKYYLSRLIAFDWVSYGKRPYYRLSKKICSRVGEVNPCYGRFFIKDSLQFFFFAALLTVDYFYFLPAR
jgi:hypothetical protein